MIALTTLNITLERRFAALTHHAGLDLAQHPRAAGDHRSGASVTGTEPAQQAPGSGQLRRPRRQPRLAAVVLGLILGSIGACKQQKEAKDKCSTQTKCSAGYKCVNVKGGGPVSGPLDVGECEEDPCAVTVPCEKPQPSQHPQEPCINDLVEACDLHNPNKFCKCISTTNNQGQVTTGNTPTTG